MTEAQKRYQAYLESDHWRLLRAAAFRKVGRKCSRCPATCRLQIHHIRYRWPWTSATTEDLIVLSRASHEKEHNISKPSVIHQPIHRKRKKQKMGRWRRDRQRVEQLLESQRRGHKLKRKQKKFIKHFHATAHFSVPSGGRPRWVNRGNSSN